MRLRGEHTKDEMPGRFGRCSAKLRSSSGVTILMALFFMLVACMIATVVLVSATTSLEAVHSDHKQQQAYLTVSSAAELVRDDLRKVTQVTEGDELPVITSKGCLGKMLAEATDEGHLNAFADDDFATHSPYSKTLLIDAGNMDGDDDTDDVVKAEVKMKYENDVVSLLINFSMRSSTTTSASGETTNTSTAASDNARLYFEAYGTVTKKEEKSTKTAADGTKTEVTTVTKTLTWQQSAIQRGAGELS